MKIWKYPYEVKYQIINKGTRLAYVEEGAGERTLLFIHGLGSNLKGWTKNIDALKTSFRCIALDLPGYGKSSKGNFPFSLDFFANAISGFVEKKGLKSITLVGHSMGGQVAIYTVLKNQNLFEKLVLIAPAGFEKFSEEEKEWFKITFSSEVIMSLSEEQIIQNFYLNFHEFPEDARFMIVDRMKMRQSEEYEYYCRMIPKCVSGMLNSPVFNNLKNLSLPTLVLYGEYDRLIPNKLLHPKLTVQTVFEKGTNEILNASVLKINHAGHFPQWEQAEQVNEILFRE